MKRIFAYLLVIFTISCSSLPEDNLTQMNLQNLYSETADYISISPVSGTVSSIIIYYPGGFVDPHAYLPWQDKLVTSVSGLMVVTVKMPANLAVLDIQKGDKILDLYPQVEHWYVTGHSLGGTMGAELIAKHPDKFQSLILLASYPASNVLADWSGAVLSVHASNDGLSTPADIENHKADLPAAYVMSSENDLSLPLQGKTHYYEIQGGNHAQFGSYGIQANDSVATISRSEQQLQLNEVISHFISKL